MTSRTAVAIAKVRPLYFARCVCGATKSRFSATDRGHITAESRTSVLTAQGRFVRTEEEMPAGVMGLMRGEQLRQLGRDGQVAGMGAMG